MRRTVVALAVLCGVTACSPPPLVPLPPSSGQHSPGQPSRGQPSPGQHGATAHLIYAGSMSASPLDLARALARAGARIAMELDINPEWVQLDLARHPGGPLRAAIRGQNRPADQFLAGWARDFITVLAPEGG
jgi:hypothetical protein